MSLLPVSSACCSTVVQLIWSCVPQLTLFTCPRPRPTPADTAFKAQAHIANRHRCGTAIVGGVLCTFSAHPLLLRGSSLLSLKLTTDFAFRFSSY